ILMLAFLRRTSVWPADAAAVAGKSVAEVGAGEAAEMVPAVVSWVRGTCWHNARGADSCSRFSKMPNTLLDGSCHKRHTSETNSELRVLGSVRNVKQHAHLSSKTRLIYHLSACSRLDSQILKNLRNRESYSFRMDFFLRLSLTSEGVNSCRYHRLTYAATKKDQSTATDRARMTTDAFHDVMLEFQYTGRLQRVASKDIEITSLRNRCDQITTTQAQGSPGTRPNNQRTRGRGSSEDPRTTAGTAPDNNRPHLALYVDDTIAENALWARTFVLIVVSSDISVPTARSDCNNNHNNDRHLSNLNNNSSPGSSHHDNPSSSN
ncbi:Unknown protein, partial [Striga hermonthica]